MAGPQLEMTCDDLSQLPPIPTSSGYTLRTSQPGDEAGWSVQKPLRTDDCMTSRCTLL
jgi:hypothetical protein